MQIPEKLKSRKLWMAVGAVLAAIGGALTEAITWSQAINTIVATVITYIAAEGTNDVVRTWKE